MSNAIKSAGVPVSMSFTVESQQETAKVATLSDVPARANAWETPNRLDLKQIEVKTHILHDRLSMLEHLVRLAIKHLPNDCDSDVCHALLCGIKEMLINDTMDMHIVSESLSHLVSQPAASQIGRA